MLRRTLLLATLAAVVIPPAAGATPRADARAIVAGLARAADAGRLTQAEAEGYRRSVARCRRALRVLPRGRSAELGAVLHDVRLQARRFTRPRALALFSMLDENVAYLRAHRIPPPKTDVHADDGILYRSFPGHGLQFHPLGNFGKLNAAVSGRRLEEAARLAAGLRARAVGREGGLVWEYYLAFGGGSPPWRSGMAQAVAAQAFARASVLLGRPRLLRVAQKAFIPIPSHYLMSLSAGPWIRHYSFASLAVLNSHLQSIVSLRTYASISRDLWATTVAERMKRTSTSILRRFDTGSWSLYALGSAPASAHYHLYVVSLLEALAKQTGDPVYARYAERFGRYASARGITALRLTYANVGDESAAFLTWAN